MASLLKDLRYAIRGLRRSPGFALVAVATLALGIGVNSSVFSVVNAILFRPIPVERPAELVDIYGHAATSSSHATLSHPNLESYRERTRTLSGLIGFANFFAQFASGNDARIVIGELVTQDYFQLLGVTPARGRPFLPEEFAAPGSHPVAVISDRMWRTTFAAAEDVVGRTFRMNGITYTIVGVGPEGFGGMFPAVTAQMWIPATMAEQVEPMGNQRSTAPYVGATRLDRRMQHWLWAKGRLAPGATVEQARAELAGIAAQLAEEFPDANRLERVTIVPTEDVRINPDIDRVLAPVGMVLLIAVALVLVVACANLANLLLARASSRRKEIAIRLAVGANRGHLVRQLLTESLLLAILGGVVALPLAMVATGAVARVPLPLPIDLGLELSPDWRVLAFTFAVAILTGIVFGLAPAMRATRPDLAGTLRDAAGTAGGRRRLELRSVLVVLQVAVSLVLVVSGALLVRSLAVAGRVDLGFDSDRVAHLSVALEMNGYDADRGGQFLALAQQRLAELPGVEEVALTTRLPLSINNNGFGLFIPGHQAAATDRPYAVDGASVDERYFRALDIALVAGRGIEAADRDESRRVAVISRTMAARFWPGAPAQAIGGVFRTRWDGPPYEVIGVVEDYKVDTPGEAPKPYLHLPMGRRDTFGNFMVRTSAPARDLLPTLERELLALDPALVFFDRGTLRDLADVRLFPVRAGAWLIGAFGLLALAVAAIGLYGVIGYSVSRRIPEIGVRKALGADPRRLVLMVLREGMTLVLIGGALGAALSAAAAQALSSVLFVGSLDLLSFGAAFLVLAIVALVANALPAARAARVDAMVAMRHY